VIVVTGGSRGIGAAVAITLARDGWDVCISFRQAQSEAERVVGTCTEHGVAARAVRTEVTSAAELVRLFDAAGELGVVRGLVNNAGVVDHASRVDEMTTARLERMFRINVVGAFLAAGEAVRRMSTRHAGDGGVIVNVSSAAARLGSPGEYVDYAASKAAIDTLTLGLAREVGREGVRVNAVRPGLIHTEIHASGGRPDRVELLRDAVPLGRGGEPQEVAEAIAWLCSPSASYVTGAILDVSGGR
jgi:NAD(P)-dependent dehydrogenase (short-subunit alcohol dehydrogenase family)